MKNTMILSIMSLVISNGFNLSGASNQTQVIEGPKDLALPITIVANENRAPIGRETTPQQLKSRLANAAGLLVTGADLVVGEPHLDRNDVVFLVLDTLELKRGARIVTGGNSLVIFVNKLISEDGQIVAFKTDTRTAASGGPSIPGSRGVSGGLVSVHVIDSLTGILHVDLTGQDGGNGGAGIPGGKGPNGRRGQDAASGIGCIHGGENGADGGPGQPGGAGGDAGAGGNGGTLELYNIGNTPIPDASYSFVADAGRPGAPGPGGPGGPGGDGGQGGSGAGFCNGGSPGNPGAPGPTGPTGHQITTPSAPGVKIVKSLDLTQQLESVQAVAQGQHN